MKAESGGYVNKTSFKVYISGAPAGLGTAAPGIGRRRQPKHEIPESGQCRVTGRQPKHEIPESGLSRIAGRRAAPVIVRPDGGGQEPGQQALPATESRNQPLRTSRARILDPAAGPGCRHCRHPDTGSAIFANSTYRLPAPGNRRKGQAKITPKVFRVDFGNILKKFTWNFVFSDKIHTFVPTTAYMAIFHHIHHHHHHFPKG